VFGTGSVRPSATPRSARIGTSLFLHRHVLLGGVVEIDAAKRYYRMLTVLAVGGDGGRPEVAEAGTYLAQN
jgi:hypothetical protein